MASVVTDWAWIETLMMFYFAILVFRDQEPQPSSADGKHSIGERIVKEAFESANSFPQKRHVFLEAVRLRFGQSVSSRAKPVLHSLQDGYDLRNTVAHGRWSVDETLGNDLIYNRSVVDERPMLYTPADFEAMRERMAAIANAFNAFCLSELMPEAKAAIDRLRAAEVHVKTPAPRKTTRKAGARKKPVQSRRESLKRRKK